MAQIVLRIATNEGADVLLGFTADKIVNNVSTDIGATTTENNGVNGKSLATGYLSLSDGYLGGKNSKLQSETDKYNGFMFGATDENGNYELTLYLQGTNLDKIIITGDKNANQFPIQAILDEGTEQEKTIYSDDLSWAIAFEQESNSHTIKFTKWNRANYNACFTTLKVMLEYLELDKGWIDSVESLSQSTSDASSIQYGVLANSGSANIRDLNGELRDYVQDGLIPNSNMPIQLFVNGQQIQSHIMSSCHYYQSDRMLSFNLTNTLGNLNNKQIKATKYGIDLPIHFYNMYGILSYIWDDLGLIGTLSNATQSKIKVSISPTKEDIVTIKDYLKHIALGFGYGHIPSGTAREILDNICAIAQLNLIEDNLGNAKFITARPKLIGNETIINIPIYSQIQSPRNDLFIYNKYTNVKFITKKFSREVNHIYKDSIALNYNDDGTLDLNNFDADDVRILHYNNNDYLCFYKDIKGNCIVTDYYSPLMGKFNGPFAYKFEIEDALTSGSGITYNIPTLNQTKEEYNPFSEPYYMVAILKPYSNLNTDTMAFSLNITNKLEKHPYKLDIDIRGNMWTRYDEQEKLINNTNSIYEFSDNNFLDDGTTIYGYSAYDIISKNIIDDYSNGIHTCEVNLFMTDFYDIYGNKVKDFSKGDLFKVGDIVNISKDNSTTPLYTYADSSPIYFKVISINLNYNGSGTIKLGLQEVKV